MKDLAFDPAFGNSVLVCPVCGGPNLHQEYVFSPSTSDEIRIGMTCESWCTVPDFIVRQHKGLTIMEWSDKRAGGTHVGENK